MIEKINGQDQFEKNVHNFMINDPKNFTPEFWMVFNRLKTWAKSTYEGFKTPVINIPCEYPNGSDSIIQEYRPPIGDFFEKNFILKFLHDFKDDPILSIIPFENDTMRYPDVTFLLTNIDNNDTKQYRIPGDLKASRFKSRGNNDLMDKKLFKKEYTHYIETGELLDHLKGIMIFGMYKNDEIVSVIVAPAICCLNIKKDGHFLYGSKNVKIGFKMNKCSENPVFFGEL